jgi:hypothetical protein
LGGNPEKDNTTIGRQSLAVREFSEVFVEGQERAVRRDRQRQHLFVGRPGVALSYPKNVITSLAKLRDRRAGKVLIRQESHAGSSR